MKIDIKRITQKTGLTQTELAEKVGCSMQYLSNLQRDDKLKQTVQGAIQTIKN